MNYVTIEHGEVTADDLLKVLRDSSVSSLELTVRAGNCLNNARIRWIWQVMVLSDEALGAIEKLGPSTVRDIRESCRLVPGFTAEIEEKLRQAFWEWAKEKHNAGDLSAGAQVQFVRDLKSWPELTASFEKTKQ